MKVLFRLTIFSIFVLALLFIIAYARGYRLDLEKKLLTPTGILAISSYPRAAKVYLDGELKGVTDLNITLPPGEYRIMVKKDGYANWEKKLILKGELVESIDALLFPINPSLLPLTNLGITKAIPIDHSENLLLFSANDSFEKDGIYLFDPNTKPISFFPPLKLIALKSIFPIDTDFTQIGEVIFSPDRKQAICNFKDVSYLLSLETENKQISPITPDSILNLTTAWDTEKQTEITKILETYPLKIKKIASDSFKMISFSPDNTKAIYQAKQDIQLPLIISPPLIASNQTQENRNLQANNYYIYDKKEDKNFGLNIKDQSSTFDLLTSILWYPDSKRIVINEEKQISISNYDSENKQVVYSGPFEKEFLSVTSDGKLIILTNLNSQINKLPDIYAVGIK